jgi:hypothetical protein
MIMELIERWRHEGEQLTNLGTWPVIRLVEAAQELERAWHEDEHNAEWRPEICRICVNEMRREYPDEKV